MHARRTTALLTLTLAALAVGGTTTYAATPATLGPDAPEGAAPAIVWSEGSTVHLEDGSSFTLPEDGYDTVLDVAAVGDRIAVTRYDDSVVRGAVRLSLLDRDGTQAGWTNLGPEATGDLETNDAGTVLAVVQRGRLALVEDGGGTWSRHALPVDRGLQLGAVTGDDCQVGCRVYLDGVVGAYRLDSADGATTRLRAPLQVADALATPQGDLVLGLHSADEETATARAGVTDDGGALWSQGDHGVRSWSPDGALVLGADAWADGAGSGTLAFLDSATGSAVRELATTDDWWVGDTAWEDAEHAIVELYDGDETSVLLRVGTDGTVERVSGATSDPRLGS
ncbi:hypothetical protein [Nocardioides zeae]